MYVNDKMKPISLLMSTNKKQKVEKTIFSKSKGDKNKNKVMY
jgi:hypothetical protein